jgi:hypothetical protein
MMSIAYNACAAIGATVIVPTTLAVVVVVIAAVWLRWRKRRGYYALAVARRLERR